MMDILSILTFLMIITLYLQDNFHNKKSLCKIFLHRLFYFIFIMKLSLILDSAPDILFNINSASTL